GGELARRHAVGHAGEERQARVLVLPVVRGAVAHLGRAVDDRIERLQRRNQLARRIHLHGQATARHRGDPLRQVLGADAEAGEVLGPRGEHSPLHLALRDRRGGNGGGAGGNPGGERFLEDGTAILRWLLLGEKDDR